MGRKCNNHKSGAGASGEDKVNMRRLAGLLTEWEQLEITTRFNLYDEGETPELVQAKMAELEPEINRLYPKYERSHRKRFGKYGWKERG